MAIEYSEYLKDKLSSNAKIIKGDAFSLPFEDKSIDCVYSIGMIEHYNKEDQFKLLKEMARVARKHLVMGIPNYKIGSASHYIIHHGEEEHLDCNLEELANYFPKNEIIFDGRGLFMAKRDVDKSQKYKDFIIENYPQLYKEDLRSNDIEVLMLNEKNASPEVRRKHGFIEYFIMSV